MTISKRLSIIIITACVALTSFKPVPDGWQEYKPVGGNCAVLMPGQPEKTEKVLNTALGEMTMNIFMLQPAVGTDKNLIYGIIYSDMPADKIHSDSTALLKTFFDNSRDGAIRNVQGTLLHETIISYKGYPGREMRVDFKNGMAIIEYRAYLIKNRYYMLQVITLSENNFNTDIKKFMESFRLLDK